MQGCSWLKPCTAVDCMRQRGCVHRDIRGANILFCEDEGEFPRRAERSALVIDFDRAKMADEQYEYDWMSVSSNGCYFSSYVAC
jgi:serine/threonine protein kinase